jgi:hypothetical protein
LGSIRETLNVEEELARLQQHPDPGLREAYKSVPLYLRDLLTNVALRYVDHPGTHAEFVTRLIADGDHDVDFVTVNYDTYLERAIEDAFGRRFTDQGGYVAGSRGPSAAGFRLFKLHGSIDWWASFAESGDIIPNDPRSWWIEQFAKLDLRTWRPEYVVIKRDVKESYGLCERSGRGVSALFPAITAPLVAKGQDSLVLPGLHREYLEHMISISQKLLIIGCGGLDHDMSDLLARNIQTLELVHFVGLGPETEASLNRFRERIPCFGQASIKAFADGFRAYVRDEGFRQFIEAPSRSGW